MHTKYWPLSLCMQEIYPPKVGEFAYVTDGACSVASITEMELIICKVTIYMLQCVWGPLYLHDWPLDSPLASQPQSGDSQHLG